MMKKILVGCLSILIIGSSFTMREDNLWALFAKTRFIEKLNREFGMYFLYPKFPEELKAYEGKTVTISGFFIPLDINDSNIAVVSKFPMAECFFCGGSGPESIVVGYLKKKPGKRINTDEIVTIRGKLKLNEDDIEELNFILLDAELILEK
ncbi:hypothetical protein [Shivajiella indica]|uniref:DUF3299 domain-containing protein n=1 Tax=Shivajiella indica TaxID=872115 RepID=A0ABW5BFR7_9BACT